MTSSRPGCPDARGERRIRADRRSVGLATLVALLALTVTRLHSISDARIMGYDEGLYLVQGMIWAEGGLPYRDGWLNKPPLLSAVFAATEVLFGPGVTPHRLLQLLTLLGASACCAWLVAACVRGRVGPVVATVTIALIASARGTAGDLWACLAEPLFALPVAAAAALALRARTLRSGRARLSIDLLTGVSLGLAFQLRQNALLLLPLAAVGAALPAERPGTRFGARLAGVAATLTGFGLVQGLAAALVWPVLDHAVYWSWTWPRSVQSFDPPVLASSAVQVVQREAARLPFVWLAALGGVVMVVRRALRGKGEARARQLLLLTWGGASLLMTIMGHGGYLHYITMLAPAAGVFAGLGAAAVAAQLDRLRVRSLSFVAGGVALAYAGAVVFPDLVRPPLRGCEQREEGARSSLLAAIRRLTGRDEKIYILGSCAPLYYRARRAPAAPDFSAELLLARPDSRRATPPGPDGSPMPIAEQLALGVARHARLVVDLRAAYGDEGLLQGFPARLGFMSDDVDLSAMDEVLAERFVLLAEHHDGVTLWLRRPDRQD